MSARLSQQPGYGAIPAKRRHAVNSRLLTTGVIIADVVGAGILSMPVVMKNFGWAVGIAVTIVSVVFNNHVGLLQHRVFSQHQGCHSMSLLTREVYLPCGEEKASTMQSYTNISQLIFLFSMTGLYVLTLGKSFGMLFYDVHICLPLWCVLGACIIFVFLASTQAMGGWSSLVGLNIITILGSIFIPLASMASDGVESTRPEGAQVFAVASVDVVGWFSATAVLMFALSGQALYVEIMSEMEDVQEFPTAFTWMAAPFMALAFVAVGAGGYHFRGDSYDGMIGDNLDFGPTFRIAALCLLIHMVVTALIKGVVLTSSILRRFRPDEEPSSEVWSSTVFGLLVATFTMSQVVPFFTDLVDLLGASLVPIVCYIIPILVYLQFDRNMGGTQTGSIEKAVIYLELLFSVVLLFGGTTMAMMTIRQKWETYGYPFQCHCEGLWNTCGCSSDHAGMEDMCPAT